MEAIRQWALCITFSALAGSIIYILSPKGATEKAIKTVISLFIITAVLSPFISGKGIKLDVSMPDNRKYTVNAGQLQEKINNQLKTAAEGEIEKKIDAVLKSFNVNGGQITVDMDIDEKGSISIKETSVKLPVRYKSLGKEIAGKIRETAGIDVKIICS